MIYRLEIENFYSFREKQVIDLTVGKKAPDEPGRLVDIHTDAERRAPNVVAVYGANASGKSNVLRVLTFLVWFIRNSFQYAATNKSLPYDKFKTNMGNNSLTRLSVHFSLQEKLEENAPTCPYIYTLELSPRVDGQTDRIFCESLYYKPKDSFRPARIFERNDAGQVKIHENFISNMENIEVLEGILRPNASVIPTLAQMNNKFALSILQSLEGVWSNIIVTKVKVSEDDPITDQHYAINNKLLAALNRDIRRIDLGIENIIMDKHQRLNFVHAGLEEPVKKFLESEGTKQFVIYFPILHEALESGGTAIIDDFDAAIHPLILPEILRWFSDPIRNPLGAQLWVSCHAVSLLDHLLKEEILFCEKNSAGTTKVHRLVHIDGIRSGENFLKNYLAGIYGGVPTIG